MQLTKSRVLSAITAGSLAFAVVAAITVGSGSGHTAQPVALAAQTGSFSPVNLDDCPILYTGYPRGECVAQLQTELNTYGANLTVYGVFGLATKERCHCVPAEIWCPGARQSGASDQGGPRYC